MATMQFVTTLVISASAIAGALVKGFQYDDALSWVGNLTTIDTQTAFQGLDWVDYAELSRHILTHAEVSYIPHPQWLCVYANAGIAYHAGVNDTNDVPQVVSGAPINKTHFHPIIVQYDDGLDSPYMPNVMGAVGVDLLYTNEQIANSWERCEGVSYYEILTQLTKGMTWQDLAFEFYPGLDTDPVGFISKRSEGEAARTQTRFVAAQASYGLSSAQAMLLTGASRVTRYGAGTKAQNTKSIMR